MQRHATVSFLSIAALLCGLGHLVGCAAPPEDALSAERAAALAACHLDDGTVDHDADLRACDPQNKKKTTICHIPPGNPANAHTLCVGNAAVPAHVRNHGDLVGACVNETPCPPPGGTGGAPVTPGTGGAISVSGTGGAGPVIVP